MLELFLTLGAGLIAGFIPGAVLKKPLPPLHSCAGKLLSLSIYLMLAIMGYQLGMDRELVATVPGIGATALLVCVCGVAGSVFAAWVLWRTGLLPDAPDSGRQDVQASLKSPESNLSLWGSLSGSLFTVLSLGAGCVAGYFDIFPAISNSTLDLPMLSLYFLLFVAGVNMGSNPQLPSLLKNIRPSIVLLPLCSIAGTILFCALGALLANAGGEQLWKIQDYVAAGSGMGYYSLSSVLLGNLREPVYGAELAGQLAAIALLSNILREVTVLVAAPFFCRIAGPYAPVAAAGATAADVCLPVLVRTSGEWILPAVLVSGFLTDFCVPFLVTWVCGL
ncbi:MAG: lysine exporter LysO family protein [Candidatus Cryptobacteroides sp.]